MTGYRINTEHDVDASFNAWTARVTRLSDGEAMCEQYGDTEQEVLSLSRDYLAAKAGAAPALGGVYFADENGTLTPAPPTPESLRA